MNKADKKRLTELMLRVWAKVAFRLRVGFDPKFEKNRDDPYVVTASEIEDHKGRFPKALRLLESEGLIIPFGKMTNPRYPEDAPIDTYRVLRFEESKEYGQKPIMRPHRATLNKELEASSSSPEKIARCGYKSDFSDVEHIYIYWHLDEYVVDPTRSYYIFEKANLSLLYKRIMRVLIERRMKEDFPGYVQMIAPDITAIAYSKTELVVPNPISFKDFRPKKIVESLKKFETELERMVHYKTDLDEILACVEKHGGFETTIRRIRQQIICDFLSGYERFEVGFGKCNQYSDYDSYFSTADQSSQKNRSKAIFRFFDRFRELCSYESLYLDPEVGTEEVEDIIIGNSWNSQINVPSLFGIDKEFGLEERNTGAAESSDASRAA